MLKEYTAVALCAVGAEKAVSNELKKLGLAVTEGGFGKLRFKADLAGLYRALMGLRAVDRLLLEAAWYEAVDFDTLFEGAQAVPWEEYLPKNCGLHVVKVRTNRSCLKAETSIQAVVHKAAAERLCRKWGINRLPDGGDRAELRVYLEKDKASLLLDLSGDPLFKRGYRIEGGTAPLRETTAAAIILLAGWKRKFSLYDPFCGSGTICAEAAMYAWDMAPGLGRLFALERFLISDMAVEKQVREELAARVDFSRSVRIGGSDADGAIVKTARANMERILKIFPGAEKKAFFRPSFEVSSFETLSGGKAAASEGGAGFIITNPPYGRRLGDTASSERIYAEMGKLARRFSGWKLALVTDHLGFESFFGRKADSCREITNGAIRSYVYQYEVL